MAGTAAFLSAMAVTPQVRADTTMTASVVMVKMNGEQRFNYIAGIVEGLATARYQADGNSDTTGMRCIYDWFYAGDGTPRKIEAAFEQYGDHYPGTIIAVMVKRACGA